MTKLPPGVTRAATAYALMEAGVQVYDRAYQAWRRRMAYTVTISDDDAIYPDVHAWLLTVMPEGKHRALVAKTNRERDNDAGPRRTKLRLLSNDRQTRMLTLEGHRLYVAVEKPETTVARRLDDLAGPSFAPESLIFTCHTKAAQEMVLRHVAEIAARKDQTTPVLNTVDKWGNWDRRGDLPLREMDSVVLPAEQRQRIVGDLRRFLDSEESYIRRGIPWHRGYLLHGPPGCGKSSIAKALAQEFHLDLFYASLGDLTKEASLMDLLGALTPRSILLLEDIDTIQVSHDRNASEQGSISTASLLNALDGVATPHGLISIMTTNHFDVLDPALTRPGRMDLVEEIGYPGRREIAELFRFFFDRALTVSLPEPVREISQAEVAEILKRNMGDPDKAEVELRDAVRLAPSVIMDPAA